MTGVYRWMSGRLPRALYIPNTPNIISMPIHMPSTNSTPHITVTNIPIAPTINLPITLSFPSAVSALS
jgi:hypothetical protein